MNKFNYFHLSIVLTTNGKLISYGVNELNTKKRATKSIHSEINAMKRLMNKRRKINPSIFRKGVIMLNFAFTFAGKLRLSKPCEHCEKFIRKHNAFIKELWYSTQEGDFKKF